MQEAVMVILILLCALTLVTILLEQMRHMSTLKPLIKNRLE